MAITHLEAKMAEITKELMDMINAPERIGVLATTDSQGQPNIAYFGSLRMNPDHTMVMGLGSNRTLANLRQNPKAAFICLAEGPVSFSTPGCRLYLTVKELDTQGELLAQLKAGIAAKAGEAAAEMITAAALFKVSEVRPLVDMG